MIMVKLILKPHPACEKTGEQIDIYSENGRVPWTSVHVDVFWTKWGNEVYDALCNRKESLVVELTVVEE